MSSRFSTHRTLIKAVHSDRDWSVWAVLSLPVEDLAGDIVRPEGLDFSAHAADPWVDLEHGLRQDVGRQPVGWARKSLWRPGEPYTVQKCALDVPGLGRHLLPIGITYFDRDHLLQRQTYQMVRQGDLPGVSLEFQPVPGCMKSRGPSPLERRDAYEFTKARVIRWTHCVEPVCPGALTVLKSLPPELDSLAKTLRDGQIEGLSLHPYIVKSLARYKPTTTLIRVEKAMPDATDTPQTAYDPTATEEGAGDATDAAPAKPTAAAHYNFADGLLQLIDQAENDLEMSEHLKGKKFLLAKLERMRAEAEAIKGMGDKIDTETTDEDGDSKADEEPSDPDMDTDEEGTLKAVRPPYRAILKAVRGVRRYSLAEVQKGIEAAKEAAVEEAREETAAEALARIRTEDPVEYERLSAKARRLNRFKTA